MDETSMREERELWSFFRFTSSVALSILEVSLSD